MIPRLALVLALVALAAKLCLAATTSGTSDVRAFQFFLKAYLGSGAAVLYDKDPNFNHPPLVLHLLEAVRWLANATGLSFSFCLRLPGILADLGSFLLLARIAAPELESESRGRSARTALALVAVAPAAILVSGFHGNTDAVMVFFTLLSIRLCASPRLVALAGLAMGASASIKIVPIVFWPAIWLWLPDLRRRVEYFAAAFLVLVAGAAPIVFQEPALLARKVLGYAGSYGLWGLSRLAEAVPSVSGAYRPAGRWILLAVLLALSFWMNARPRKPALFRQIGVLATAFLALAPAFGLQYLIWILPFLVGLPLAAVATFLALSGAFLALVYTFWCQGVEQSSGVTNWLSAEFWRLGTPWDYANADQLGPWRGELVPVEIACWLCVVVLFALQVRAARDASAP